MKSTQVGVAVLTQEERKRRTERAALRDQVRKEKEAKEAAEALAKELAEQRAANPLLAAIDAQEVQVVNPRVTNGGKA